MAYDQTLMIDVFMKVVSNSSEVAMRYSMRSLKRRLTAKSKLNLSIVDVI